MAKKPRQQTLETTLGRPPLPKRTARKKPSLSGRVSERASERVPDLSSSPARSQLPSSSLLAPGSSKKRPVVLESSSSSADETAALPGDEDDSDVPLVPRLRQKKAAATNSSSPSQRLGATNQVNSRLRQRKSAAMDSSPRSQRLGTTIQVDSDEEDDLPRATPRSLRSKKIGTGSNEDERDDEVGKLSASAKRRRLVTRPKSTPRGRARQDDDEYSSDQEVAARDAQSSPSRAHRKTPRTGKEKAREILRRKRAGEVIDDEELASSLSNDSEQVKGIYDTDSELEVLVEFEDDEEGVSGEKEPQPSQKKGKSKARKRNSGKDDEAGDDEDMDDFVVEDDDAPLGVPSGLLDIPLQFTAHAHKPLKDHFRHAVEWLVQSQINPGFPERHNDVYRLAWRRLGDEVSGLASSKFSSSAWKMDFQLALRARPYMDSQELPKGDVLTRESCGACGRSGHPATFRVTFSGTPYYKSWGRPEKPFLDPVEGDSDDSDSDDSDSDDSSDDSDVDEDGNSIPKQTKQWLVGSVCNSNADTAHTLTHWHRSLLDWVEASLDAEGHLKPENLAKTRKMKPGKRYKLVDGILKNWDEKRTINTIYSEFKSFIETARNKSTTGRQQRGWK